MGRMSGTLGRSVQIAAVAIFIGLWVLATRAGGVSPLLLPPPGEVWHAVVELVQTGEFWVSARVTALTILQAFAIAAVSGIGLAYLITRSSLLTEAVEPIIAGAFAIPLTLFFPLFLLFFGIGTSSKIAYAAVYGVFPILLNTIAGFSTVQELHLRSARAMGARPVQMMRHVLLPAAFPVILTGLRIGFFITLASVLGGETLASVAGVGRSIALSAEMMDSAQMYAWIVFVVVTTTALNLIASTIENRRRGS